MSEKETNFKLDKLIETQDKFITNVNKVFRTTSKNEVQPQKDKFLVKTEIVPPLIKKSNSLLTKIFNVETETLSAIKKNKSGFLSSFGKLLSLGGLAGYLFTGKPEFLMDLAKGFIKYLPTKILVKPIDMFLNGFTKLFSKSFGKVFEKLHIGDLFKPLKNLFTKGLDKIFGKTITVGIGKILGKTGGKLSKTLLKKIPGVGAIMGLFFGIERFKKGDNIGGIGEIASGIASIFPGPGTLISAVIDGLLLLKDFGVFGKQKEKTVTTKKVDIREIPVIGLVVKAWDAIMDFKKDPKLSLQKLANSVENFIPGVGKKLGEFGGWLLSLKDFKFGDFAKDSVNKVKDWLNLPKKDENFQVSGKSFTLKDKNVNLSGIDKSLLDKFSIVADKYFEQTGKKLQINSAFRSNEEQAEYKKSKEMGLGFFNTPVAQPGKSAHNYGNALDINWKNTNKELLSQLLQEQGLYQPYKDKNDPQHIELSKGANFKNAEVTFNNPKVNGVVKQDKTNESNVANIPDYFNNTNELLIKLSDETINKLALKIAEEGRANIPTFKQKQVVSFDSRG